MPSRKKGVLASGPYAETAWAGCAMLALVLLAAWLWQPTGQTRAVTEAGIYDPDPLDRAAYATNASDAELIVLAGDTDWRVRAAAFQALSARDPIKRPPMRDTPIDERETLLLNWLDRNHPRLPADLCSIYAQPNHARFGNVLVEQCLTCHTGPQPEPRYRDTSCIECHPAIHADWADTAHANSLSHLVLPTVDTTTRQPGTFGFGELKGLSCVACHEPLGAPETVACLATFNTTSCRSCHARTATQWEAWAKAPRYRPAAWPPGSVQRVEQSEPSSCSDCHMPDGQHLWGARRDIDLLRSGVVMRYQEEGGIPSITLQNLAGHAYPSGGVRRAIQLYVQVDEQPETLLAIFADNMEFTTSSPETQPALQPNETREITLPQVRHNVHVRLVYIRNRFDEDSYRIEIQSLHRERPGPVY